MRPIHFDLSLQRPSKTIDIGNKGSSLSADPLGRLLQLSTFHPQHGIVVASPYEQFDAAKFCDPLYVREYRSRMLDMIQAGQPGFGLRFEGQAETVDIDMQGSKHAQVRFFPKKGAEVCSLLHVGDDGEVVQMAVISSDSPTPTSLKFTLDLGISVHRASYGQLTEGGPIPLPKSENEVRVLQQGTEYAIVNSRLGAHLHGCLELDGNRVRIGSNVHDATYHDKPAVSSYSSTLDLKPGSRRTLVARFWLRPNLRIDGDIGRSQNTEAPADAGWNSPDEGARFIIRRNLDYILGNCAIPLDESTVALITDHVALPLGWNRDNYWQIRFLLDVYQNIDTLANAETAAEYRRSIKATVRGHLNWAYCTAQRPFKFWHRSYLVTGRPKDGPVFQLDQQCYPLLELCDFLAAFPQETEFVRRILHEGVIEEIFALILERRDRASGLFPTEETPGDDAVEFPFHFSSHILLWHTLARLSRLLGLCGDTPNMKMGEVSALADEIRSATLEHFLAVNADTSKEQFAYLVDGHRKKTFYHDANDIPTLFAVDWNFVCTPSQVEAWRNTMDFAFSEMNQGGYYAGRPGQYGGLGSVHTRGPWPLGFLQELVYANLTKNSGAEQDAWRRIYASMQWDGLFSEAIDIRTAQCTSKAWFSWPGSMIGSALLRPELRSRYVKVGRSVKMQRRVD